MEWELENGKYKKGFQLKSFTDIILKLNDVALVSDELDHHPDVLIENYNTVTFYIYNHQQNQGNEKNLELIKRINILFN
jgi:4a-hydroxytetrahydrobiopterin dehydratase